jgi:integrase
LGETGRRRGRSPILPKHLELRPSGIYGFRFDVPQRLQSLLGKRKFLESLQTRDLATALVRHKAVTARVLGLIHTAEAALMESPARLTPVELAATERAMAEALLRRYQQPPAVIATVPGLPADHPLADLSLSRPASDDYQQQALAVAQQFQRAVAAGPGGARQWRDDQVQAAQMLLGRLWHPDDAWAIAIAHGRALTLALGIASGRHQDWARYLEGTAAMERLPDPAMVLVEVGAAAPGEGVLDLVEVWITARAPAPKTAVGVRAIAQRFVAVVEVGAAAAVTADHARAFRDHRLEEGLAGSTVRKDLALLRAVWSWAVSEGRLPADPWANVRVTRGDDGRSQRLAFNEAQVRLLLERSAELSDTAQRWSWPLGLLLGLRIEEIACLRREDLLELDGIRCLQIRHEAQLRGSLKTRSSERVLPLPQALLALGWWEWATSQPAGWLFVAGGIPASDPRRSHGLSIKNGVALRNWGITDRRLVFHSTRHTFNARAVQAGLADRMVQSLTGHSQGKSMTARYSGEYTLAQLRDAIEQIQWPIDATQPRDGCAAGRNAGATTRGTARP